MRSAWMRQGVFGNIVIVTFLLMQFLDGIFTYIGVTTWGLSVEFNPILVWAMSVVGVGLGLIAVKLVAIGFGGFLYWHGRHKTVALLAIIFLIFGVALWAYLFLTTQALTG
jgi:hypothetical protein